MGTNKAFQVLLKRFDDACLVLRKIHEDKTHLNNCSADFLNAMNAFNSAQRDLFTFKDMMNSVRKG